MGVLNPDGTDQWKDTAKPWWNILLYTNGGKPFKYVVKKIEGVWFVKFGVQHENTVALTKQALKRKGAKVRSYPKQLPCTCAKKSSRGKCRQPRLHKHRVLWTDRIAIGTYGRGGIKMVSDLIEQGEWV